jgi:hypothetical protein
MIDKDTGAANSYATGGVNAVTNYWDYSLVIFFRRIEDAFWEHMSDEYTSFVLSSPAALSNIRQFSGCNVS